MKNFILICSFALVGGCLFQEDPDGKNTGYSTNCTVDPTVRPGRVINRPARCAANPKGGVQNVTIQGNLGKSNYPEYWTMSVFSLTDSEWSRLQPILTRADSDPSLENRQDSSANPYDFSIFIQERKGTTRMLMVKFEAAEPFYGTEFAAWVKDELPKIAKAAAVREAAKPRQSDDENAAEVEQALIDTGKWRRGKGGILERVPEGEVPKG